MTFTPTRLTVVFFGGPLDGGDANIENNKENIKVEGYVYSDSFFMDKEGRAIYFCSKGAGRLTRTYVNKLFKDLDCI